MAETFMVGCAGNGYEVGGIASRAPGGEGVEAAHDQFLRCIASYKGCYHGLPYIKIQQGRYGMRKTVRVILPVRY